MSKDQVITEELMTIFLEAIRADEGAVAAIQKSEQLQDKQQRLKAGIVALQADLAKTEAAIDEDRLTLAEGSAADVTKLNRKIAGNIALIETTRQSIEAMQRQVEAMQRDLRDAVERIGSESSSVINRRFFEEYQSQVSEFVKQAVALATAYNSAASAVVREVGGRPTLSSRPHRLHLGDAGSLFHFLDNHQTVVRGISEPSPEHPPAYAPPWPVAQRMRGL